MRELLGDERSGGAVGQVSAEVVDVLAHREMSGTCRDPQKRHAHLAAEQPYQRAVGRAAEHVRAVAVSRAQPAVYRASCGPKKPVNISAELFLGLLGELFV